MESFRRRFCCGFARSNTTTPSQNVLAPNSPIQQPTNSSAGASSSNLPSTKVKFSEISNTEQLKECLDQIDEEISRQEKIKGSGGTGKVPDLITGNLKETEDLFGKLATSCKNIPFTDVANESQKVLADALKGLGSVHWVATGFSLIAFVLTRINQVGSNFDACIRVLKTLRDLGRHVVNLDPLLHDNDGKLQQAIALISEGAILCDSHLKNSVFKRFALASVSTSNFEALEKQISLLYPDLQLSLLIRQSSLPLAAQEHEDPPENTIALEEKVAEVLQLLGMIDERTLEKGVQAITLHGMGGIGKTTLGNAVCKKLSFMEGFARVEMSMEPNDEEIRECQRIIGERLSGQKQRIGDCADGRQVLKSHLQKRGHPTLLFIDNVVHESHLTKLLPKEKFSEIFADQSRIIVTSRDERLSEFFEERDIKSERYSVPTLEHSPAEKFFTGLVFEGQAVPQDRRQSVNEVLKSCDGLPLALEISGRYLRRHINDTRTWDIVINCLKNLTALDGTSEDRLVKSLSFSYDLLSKDNKIAFLDIVCLLRNFEWERADAMFRKELADLKSLALVKKSPSAFGTDRVGVHDLIVALARRNQLSPLRRIRVDIKDFTPKHLPDDIDDEGSYVEGLVIKSLAGFIPAETLDAMSRSLRILILEDIKVNGQCTRIPRHLVICSTTGSFPFKNLADFKELRVWRMSQNSDMSLHNVELPRQLTTLDLDECHRLQSLPATLGELSSLHTLKLRSCSNLQDLPGNFGQLRSLRNLVISGCEKLEALPKDFNGLQSLQILQLSSCERLQKLPHGFKNLVNLQTLQISKCDALSKLPAEILRLKSLQVLQLCSCEMLQEPRLGLRELTNLRHLDFSGSNLTKLPNDFSDLSSLNFVNLSHCRRLQKLPDEFSCLTQLKSLRMSTCSQLEELPCGFWNLGALEDLYLDKCEKLKSLPSDFPLEGPVTRLKCLDLSECSGLRALPDGFGRLTTLERLDVTNCTGLTYLPEDFFNLTALRRLSFGQCSGLQELPDGLERLVNLEDLDFSGCEKLTSLAKYDFSRLTRLRRLDLWQCTQLKEWPRGLQNLAGSLREIDISESGLYVESLPPMVADALESIIRDASILWLFENLAV